ncbi:MAG: hypothetical protein NTX25_04875, partial [Proteobacteria bacterium]|nr:hypothetical protein [Pseudomonadota bacterium]
RYIYLLPIWTFIGFVVLRDRSILRKIFMWLSILMVLKSLQSLFLYFTNRAYYSEAEYIYEHFFSAYAAVAMVCMLYYFWKYSAPHLRLFNGLGFIVTLYAYILNDRRTSYVALIFAIGCLVCLLPKKFYQAHARRYAPLLGGFALFTALTWNLPAPFGFLGSLYRSFGSETGEEGPSYRDLENANMLREVAIKPFTGLGYGKEFEEVFPMPSVAAVYKRYKMIPHNNLLAAWCYGGPLTMSALCLLFVAMIALAGRMILDPDLEGYRFLGIASLFYFVQYFCSTFGDLGFQVNRNLMLGGLLFGSCFRLYMQRKKEPLSC